VFEPSTREEAASKPHLLICNEHNSHISGSFIAYCEDHGITLLIILPHSLHYCQPLDVAVFGLLIQALSQKVDRLFSTGISRIQKVEWLD
jgi:hypothetical protein